MDTFLKIRIAVLLIIVAIVLASLFGGARSEGEEFEDVDFVFAVLGDAPYNPAEERRFENLLTQLDQEKLSFVVHVGDILASPCSEERYKKSLQWFNQQRHPLIYTPGDNEWTDCVRRGGPEERLAKLREVFYSTPERSLGKNPIKLASQGIIDPRYDQFVENVRWQYRDIVFANVHLVGSQNGMQVLDPEAVALRTQAATEWMQAAFRVAQDENAKAVVICFHANPLFEAPPDNEYRRAYEPFLAEFATAIKDFAKPVLAINGDNHEYLIDRPLVDQTTGLPLTNFTRMQVPGSPDVGYVKVAIDFNTDSLFRFQSKIIPRWKLWQSDSNN